MHRDGRSLISWLVIAGVAAALVPVSAGAETHTQSAPAVSDDRRAGGSPSSADVTPAAEPTQTAEPSPSTEPTSSPEGLMRLEDDDPRVRFSGRWKYANDGNLSGRGGRWSRTRGAAARMAFDGTGVSVIGVTGPAHGRMRVYLDGVATATVDLYAPVAATNVPVWSVTGLPAGAHTLKLEVTGSRASSASAAWVHVDAFDIEGKPASLGALTGVRVQERDRRLYRAGSWSTVATDGASAGTLMRTSRSGTSVTVRFKGTGLTWLGSKGPDYGRAVVYVDGKRYRMVSQYATSSATGRVVWAITSLSNRVHSVTIKSLSEPSVSGGGVRTDVDALQVNGKVMTALRPAPFKYGWRTYIVIDKSQFKLYWVKNGMLVKVYPIAHGKPGWGTPERVWRVGVKYKTSWGSVYGPRKMRLFKRVGGRYVFTAYGIHGTNQEWVIGTRASHGCIRMYNRDVLELFPQVPVGTPVVTRN